MRTTATHEKLLEQMISCGYQVNKEGTCYGYTHMWVHAVLSGEEKLFHERVLLICETKDLHSKIQAVRKKTKIPGTTLSVNERNLLEVMAFFDGIELYQQPENYPGLFHKKTHQKSIHPVAKLVSSKAMDEAQGLVILHDDQRVLSPNETTEYFIQLRKILRESYEQKEPIENIPIAISSYSTHGIGLRYNYSNDNWILVDSNNMPTLTITTENIANEVMKKLGEPKMLGMHIQFYTTLKLEKKFSMLFQKLQENKKNQTFTKEWVERKSQRGFTLPEMAIWFEDDGVVEKLKHMNLPHLWNQIDEKSQQNLLHLTAYSKNVSIIEYLLKTKVDPNLQDINGRTPLHYATELQNTEIINALIDAKSDLNLQDKEGKIPLHFAIENKQIDIIKKLLNKHSLNIQDKNGRTPLMYAIDSNEFAIIELILQQPDVDLLLLDISGKSSLHYAIRNKNTVLANLLIERKDTDVNQIEKNFEMSPLHLAARYGMHEVVDQLIASKADVNALDFREESPLFHALLYGYSMMKVLLEHKANPNQQTKGASIFHSIASLETIDEEIVKLLIEHKGDLTISDHEGRNIFHYGAATGHIKTLQILAKNFSDPSILNTLINKKATEAEVTPLHIAVEENEPEYVKALIKLKADITVRNDIDLTPFQLAISNENYDLAELFVTLGKMDINEPDELDMNPVLYFVKDEQWKNVVNILLSTESVYTHDLDHKKLLNALLDQIENTANPEHQLGLLNQVLNQENALGKLFMSAKPSESLVTGSIFYESTQSILLAKRTELEKLLDKSEHKLSARGKDAC